MKRKLLSLVLVAAMLASMLVFAPTSGAAVDTTSAEVAVTDATVAAGGTVSVDVIFTTEKVQFFDVTFKYDATKLELVTWFNGLSNLPAEVLGAFAAGSGQSQVAAQGLVGFGSSNALAQDASNGLAIATITFNVKADATPGDTYVEFVASEGFYIGPSTSHANITPENITTKAGKITILPAGYELPAEKVVLDGFVPFDGEYGDYANLFEYEMSDVPCIGILGYSGAVTEGDVAFPSEIDELPVTTIMDEAFMNSTYSSVEFPSTVSCIGEKAFFGASSTTSVYILNPDCEIGTEALGFYQKKVMGQNKTYKVSNFTIYGYAGSTAQTYAEDNGFTFVEYAPETTLTYTVGEETFTYVVGNSTTAPGSAVVDGEVIVAWNDGANNIAPGASMTIAESTVLTPVTIAAPATDNGASVKVGATADDFALRFTSKLAIEDYEALFALDEIVKLGMLITPQKYVDYSAAFTKADLGAWAVSQGAAASAAYVDVAINGYYEKDDVNYTLAGSLKGFSGATLAKNPTFAAIAYAEITIGDTVVTVYGSYDKACGRDAKTVLSALSAAGTLGGTEQGWLDTLIGKFT